MPSRLQLVAVAGTMLCALSVGVCNARSRPESYDARIMAEVAEGLIDRQSPEIKDDEFGFNTPYATYGLGTSLVMIPPSFVAKETHTDRRAAVMLVNPMLLAVIAGLAIAFARITRATWQQAVVLSAVCCFATMLLPYTATGFAEPGVAAAILGGLIAIEGSGRSRGWAPILAGFATSVALLFRTDSAVLVAPFIAAATWWCAGRSRRVVIQFGAGFAPGFCIWAGYNWLRFGAPWKLGYAGFGFDTPILKGLYGLTLSPGRGVLWYAPILVVAAIGLPAAWRRNPPLAAAAVGMFVARLLFFGKWDQWHGGVGWGPRFMVPTMPLLAIGVLEVVRQARDRSRSVLAIAAVIAATSVFVQIVGTVAAYETHWNKVATPEAQRRKSSTDFYFYEWKYFPIGGEAEFMTRGPLYRASRFLSPKTEATPLTVFSTLAVLGGLGALAAAAACDRPDANKRVGRIAVPR